MLRSWRSRVSGVGKGFETSAEETERWRLLVTENRTGFDPEVLTNDGH